MAAKTPDEPKDCTVCHETVKFCDTAFKYCRKSSENKTEVMGAQSEEIDRLNKRNAELEANRDSIWNNSFLWFVVGAGLGIAGFGVVQGLGR